MGNNWILNLDSFNLLKLTFQCLSPNIIINPSFQLYLTIETQIQCINISNSYVGGASDVNADVIHAHITHVVVFDVSNSRQGNWNREMRMEKVNLREGRWREIVEEEIGIIGLKEGD